MPSKKDNLPLNVEKDIVSTGTITYANEVIAIIAGVATSEVEGIAGMVTSGGLTDILGRNRNITRGVKVELGTEETSVDLYVIIEYGTPIQKAARDAQENVRKAIETMTGLRVVRVDVHVQGVSFEKENKALEKGLQSAALASGEAFKKVTGKKEATHEEAPVHPVTVELTEDAASEERDLTEPEDETGGPDILDEPEAEAGDPDIMDEPEAEAEGEAVLPEQPEEEAEVKIEEKPEEKPEEEKKE